MAKPKARLGRPPVYDPSIHPKIVSNLAALGFTNDEMAAVFSIDRSTWYRWQTEHPEFRDSVEEGKQKPIHQVEAALFRLATGYTFEGTNGQEVKHPDIRAVMFYLSNVAPERWRRSQEVNVTVGERVPLVLIEEVEVERDGQAGQALPVPDEGA